MYTECHFLHVHVHVHVHWLRASTCVHDRDSDTFEGQNKATQTNAHVYMYMYVHVCTLWYSVSGRLLICTCTGYMCACVDFSDVYTGICTCMCALVYVCRRK